MTPVINRQTTELQRSYIQYNRKETHHEILLQLVIIITIYFIQDIIMHMPIEKLREVLVMLLESYPSLVFHVSEPAERQPGGHHPEDGSPVPDWCVCGKCREMPTDRERMCCGRVQCISTIPVRYTVYFFS